MQWERSGIVQEWWVDLLDLHGNLLQRMGGVKSFSVDFQDGADVKGSGTLEFHPDGPFEWRDKMCRIWIQVNDQDAPSAFYQDADDALVPNPLATGGAEEFAVLTALMEVSGDSHDDQDVSVAIKLLDLTARLDSQIADARSLDVGTSITTMIREYLVFLGFANPAITESSKTLSAPLYWDAGTMWRRVLNDLCDAIGYSAIWADEYGNVHAEPYVLPKDRPISAKIRHGPTSTFKPQWTTETNATEIINHLFIVAVSTADEPPLTVERFDDDPDSPWSSVSRGRTISRVETNVEAADQETLDGHADRLWSESRALTRSMRIDMRWQPFRLGQRVIFTGGPTSWGEVLDTTATVQGITLNGDAGQPLSLAQINLKEVA